VQLILWSPLAFYMLKQIKITFVPALVSQGLLTRIFGAWALLATGVLCSAILLNLYQAVSWFV